MIQSHDSSRLVDALAVGLLAIIATTVVPLGGNRPFVWGATGLLLGFMVLVYTVAGRQKAVPMPDWRWEAWAFVGFLALALVQVLPIPSSVSLDHVTLVTGTLSLAQTDSLLSLLTWVQFGVVFAFAAVAARNKRRSSWMLETLFWLACAQAAFGLVSLFAVGDTLLGASKVQYQGFAIGTFVNRNSFATYVAAAIPIGIAILATTDAADDPVKRRWLGAARAAGLLLLVAALVASGSRMGLVAGAAGAILAILLVPAAGGLLGRAAGLIAVVVCAMLVVSAFGAPLLQRIVDPGDDLANRITLYSQVWEATLSRPLPGYGGGAFAAVFPVFQHAPLPGELVWQRAHSTYLTLWLEYGLVAGSIPIVIVVGLWLNCFRSLFRHGANRAVLATVTSVPVFALHAAVDFSLEIHAVALFMTLLLALGTGAARGVREQLLSSSHARKQCNPPMQSHISSRACSAKTCLLSGAIALPSTENFLCNDRRFQCAPRRRNCRS